MYPRNAASPERIAIGAVVQISDGVIQTAGVSVSVHPQGGSESAGGGTLAFNTGGEALYTPTQAETNHTSFIVTAYKTGCFPISQTVVTTATSVPGQVDVGTVAGVAQAGVNLGTGINDIKGANFSGTTDSLEKIRDRLDTVGSSASSPAADKVYTLSWVRTVGDNDGGSSSDATTVNGVSFVTGEVTGTTLLEVDGTVTVDAQLETPMAIKLWAQYSGTGGHYLEVKAYNYTDLTWEPVGTITNTAAITPFTFNLSAQHINRTTKAVAIKVIHGTATGNPAHFFAIDKGLLLASSAVTVLDAPAIADAVWDEVISPSNHNVKNSAAYKLWRHAETLVHAGIAQGPGTLGAHNQIQLDTGASSVDGAYDPALVFIVGGAGAGQSRNILQYVGSTRTATVDRGWKIDPDVTSEFMVVSNAGREHVNEGLAQGGGAETITLNAQASPFDDAYNAQVIFIRSGLGEDQARRILDYNGTTKEALVSRPWATVPDATSAYVVLPTGAISDNCIGRAVWSDQLGDYTGIAGSSAEALAAARDNAALSQSTIAEGLFALFQGCKDWGEINSVAFTGEFQNGGYLAAYYTESLGSGGGTAIGHLDDTSFWNQNPGYDALNSKNAILRIDAGNIATTGVFTITYTSLLDRQQHTWSVRLPAVIDWDECWNVLPDGRLRPCDSGAMMHSFNNEPLIQDMEDAGIGGGGGATPEQIDALIEALGMVASHQYHPGTIVNPVETQTKDLTLYCNTDYDNVRFNVGAQWGTYLNEADVEVWFTVRSDKAVLFTVQGEIEDANTGALLLDLTAAQTNVKPGTYDWQYMLRRPITAGDPPVTTVKRRMMMDGKVYMKPSFRA